MLLASEATQIFITDFDIDGRGSIHQIFGCLFGISATSAPEDYPYAQFSDLGSHLGLCLDVMSGSEENRDGGMAGFTHAPRFRSDNQYFSLYRYVKVRPDSGTVSGCICICLRMKCGLV